MDFTLEDLQDRTVVRVPGSINGQQFMIRNCTNCVIFLLDHMATITIDKCVDCQFILGPVKGSLFLRNCKDCRCLCPCQQFRTRDCSKTDVFLFCQTQPIIEASFRMRFGCYQFHYEGLDKQFKNAGLEVMNNTWDTIYDFTPSPETGPNWSLIPEDTKIEDIIRLATEADEEGDSAGGDGVLNRLTLPKDMTLKTNPELSIVPMTAGERGKAGDESCFLAICSVESSQDAALGLIRELSQESVSLIKAKETTISGERALEIFGEENSTFVKAAEKAGKVIGLEFDGNDCTMKCENARKSAPRDVTVFSSSSPDEARQQIDSFFSSNEMQMI